MRGSWLFHVASATFLPESPEAAIVYQPSSQDVAPEAAGVYQPSSQDVASEAAVVYQLLPRTLQYILPDSPEAASLCTSPWNLLRFGF